MIAIFIIKYDVYFFVIGGLYFLSGKTEHNLLKAKLPIKTARKSTDNQGRIIRIVNIQRWWIVAVLFVRAIDGG
ncbi:hypothetical protein [Entomohabitans teleogrylli]|uniref:hypothetical protein n=1 Tax=Entomohabitans teleogrylli TaxID=1384589 RepID=UPI00073DA39B|nr:hypothetical protein [Entomohabitans teleogrylli]